jgi:uncharacterized membrane protein YjjP (DUF1212 family)
MHLQTESDALGTFMLDAGTAMLRSGASCSRIRITMTRFAQACKNESHIAVGARAISITLHDESGAITFNGTRSTTAQGVNFRALSGISLLSWSFIEKKLSLQEAKDELRKLMSAPHHPRWVTLLMVSLAGAAFCFTFGGHWVEMGITFGATFAGLFTKQELVKKAYNTYICTFISALVAAMFTGAFYKAGLGTTLEHAFSTCVLFLIPGVPLINAFTDLIDGYILNGVERGINALMHALAIAFGLAAAMMIYNFQG